MVSELDIYRAANLLIKRHGDNAEVEAVRLVDRMLDHGDREWQRIRRAVLALQAPQDGPAH